MILNNNNEVVELVSRARLGDKSSLDRLSELAIGPLHRHVFRITLREGLAEDIVQESLLEMCQIIGKLRDPQRFWPWLYGIALNKIRHHYRQAKRNKTVPLTDMNTQAIEQDNQDGLATAISDELKQAVTVSIGRLKPQHRAVLSMRCYEQMDYNDIAESLNSNTFAVRMLFYRAKKSLAKELARSGYPSLSIILALVLFGKMTAVSQAAAANVSVGASATGVGAAATTLGILSGKAALTTYMVTALISIGTIAHNGGQGSGNYHDSSISSTPAIHSQQLIDNNIPVQNWYYYPGSIDGVVMTQQVAVNPNNSKSRCLLLQNHQGSFYYPSSGNTIYLRNYRYFNPDLSVYQLPADTTDFTRFLAEVQGWAVETKSFQSPGNGLLVITQRQSSTQDNSWKIIRHYNLLGEDYFRCDWPGKSKLEDQRDEIHKQGWAYFKITGNINNKKVDGCGRIPLNYAMYSRHTPWLRVRVGSDVEIMDTPNQAVVKYADGKIDKYNGLTFFIGQARPWIGLHTIDIIRRDAISKRLRFSTQLMPDKQNVKLTITENDCKITYLIDLYQDLVKEIKFENSDTTGHVKFEYFNSADNSEFLKEPKYYSKYSKTKQQPAMAWLLNLTKK